MMRVFKVSLATALTLSCVLATTPEAMAKKRHQQHSVECVNPDKAAGIIVLGLMLGAVTGGVGTAIAYGGAYAVGGAAIGGGAGLVLGAVHSNGHCY
jgi:hypothetical protein